MPLDGVLKPLQMKIFRNGADLVHVCGVICSPEPGDSLDPSTGGLAGGGTKSAGSGGNSLGSYTAGRHKLFHICALAFGAFRRGIAGAKDEILKTVAARFALILINRHFSILSKNFPYNNCYAGNVNK